VVDEKSPVPVASAARGAYTRYCGTVNAAGVNQLIAAPPAGHRIVVRYFVIQNESVVATTLSLRNGGVPTYRYLAQYQGDGLAAFFTAGDDWELSAAVPLNLFLSGANLHGYSVGFWVEAIP